MELKNQHHLSIATHGNITTNSASLGKDSPIPQLKSDRDHIHRFISDYLKIHHLVPPLSLEELSQHAEIIIKEMDTSSQYKDFVTVLLNNAVWEPVVKRIPYNRRILLLPQCLRDRDLCPAELDEFGLLCEQCGNCATGSLQAEAEAFGYLVLVAEGTTVVTKLLETGQVDCVIGVSCLSSLERSFPFMASAAIPGMAIPLVKEGCNKTAVDVDYVREMIHLNSSEHRTERLNLEELKSEVMSWFERSYLFTHFQLQKTKTECIALDWMARGGKRWRPFLGASIYKALCETGADFTKIMSTLAIAIECFHKASLVHDDIEDNDDVRYGMTTLHKKYGVPIALNVGDFLLGEGYRLISECDVPTDRKAAMLAVAARGHRNLCLGQGEELMWIRHPKSLTVSKVLDIFLRKTAPAFEVALSLGAIAAGANGEICDILKKYSEALGIAYQIQDDIEDFRDDDSTNDLDNKRPSLLLALAIDKINQSNIKENFSQLKEFSPEYNSIIRKIIHQFKLKEKAWQMYDHYKNEALRSLRPLKDYHLKGLLFRLVHKILGNTPDLPISQDVVIENHELKIIQSEPIPVGKVVTGHGW